MSQVSGLEVNAGVSQFTLEWEAGLYKMNLSLMLPIPNVEKTKHAG